MALEIKTTIVHGSPAVAVLTDIAPGKTRPSNYGFTHGSPIPLIPIAIGIGGLVVGALWGKKALPGGAIDRLNSELLQNKIWGEQAKTQVLLAERDKTVDAIENPTGISRETAEAIAKGRYGLEERKTDEVIADLTQEREFRLANQPFQQELTQERIREVRADAEGKEFRNESLYQRSLTAASREALDLRTLETQAQVGEEMLDSIREAKALAREKVLGISQAPPIVGVRAIGPGVPGGGRLERLFGT